ncbi:neuronal acetylcholine receptor subunit alpha-10-like [Lytechinus variegatus]|uniref:neuronal acetylcholine receptor subunit alpha-10-like n=1 Tax=Lytechinus variegatus TaxID=7654 RepID=UPI001BB1D05A|nr:neuronal acetylcholine receptor subunit alpha-10-like [Lytechinus variegatus]
MDHHVAKVTSDGMVEWFSSAVLHSTCLVRPQYFPFDKQYCKVILASWAYDTSLVTIKDSSPEGPILLQHFMSNGVWDLPSIEKEQVLKNWTCCTNPYSEIHYLLIFKRQPAYYVITLIVPGSVLSMVSLLVFFMPPDSEEKVALASSNLLAMLLFQELVSTSMPPIGDQFPLIGSFFVASIVVSTFSILASLFIMHLHNKDNRPVPMWLQKLTGSHYPKPVQSRPTWVNQRLSGLICTVSKAVYPIGHRQETFLEESADIGDGQKPLKNENTDNKSSRQLETKDETQWKKVALEVNRAIAFLLTILVALSALVIIFKYIVQEEEDFLDRI